MVHSPIALNCSILPCVILTSASSPRRPAEKRAVANMSRAPNSAPTPPLSRGTFGRGKRILDYSNVLIFSFLPRDRSLMGCGAGSTLLSGSVLQTVKCLSGSLYTLNVRIKCLITLTMTAESHDSIRAPATKPASWAKAASPLTEKGSVLFKVQMGLGLTWIKTGLQIFWDPKFLGFSCQHAFAQALSRSVVVAAQMTHHGIKKQTINN